MFAEDVVNDLLSEARFQMSDARRTDIAEDERVLAAGLYLETVAALEAVGVPLEDKGSLPTRLIHDALAELSTDVLQQAADDISDMIHNAIDDPFDSEYLEALSTQLDWALMFRQSFHRRLVGARILLGEDIHLSEQQREAVEYFDALIRPLSWGLTFNTGREGHALMVAPEHRDAHWWWSEALDIRWEALAAASEVSDILERYPTFELYFERLRRASRVRLGTARPADLPI